MPSTLLTPKESYTATSSPPIFSSRSSAAVRDYLPRAQRRHRQSLRQRLDGSPGKHFTDFKSEFIHDFDYSFDGKQLVVLGHRESDVVLVRSQEK
jgi:hypothetical protein